MKETRIIGLTAIVSSGLATILLVSLIAPMIGGTNTPVTLTVNSSSNNYVKETLRQSDRWVVDFSSAQYVYSWLLTEAQYSDYLYYGSVNGYQSSDSGYEGHYVYTVTSGGTYRVVFEASMTASVTVTTRVIFHP